MLTNFLANSPMAWLNFHLTPYLRRKGIIPSTQVACQQGTQQRDLISFLNNVKNWAERNERTIYVLKPDQTKGFDFLSPEGFYDATRAYGLPQSIIEMNKAALYNNKCIPKTAFGPAESFVTSGLTRQGGSISPLKCVMTSGMLHMWVRDCTKNMEGQVSIRKAIAMEGKYHTPADTLEVRPLIVEAMDDSLIMAFTLALLIRVAELLERAQYTYGSLTKVEKTHMYALGLTDGQVPETVIFKSISKERPDDPNAYTEHLKVERKGAETGQQEGHTPTKPCPSCRAQPRS